jgi:rhodanese-related sulfurtransferase
MFLLLLACTSTPDDSTVDDTHLVDAEDTEVEKAPCEGITPSVTKVSPEELATMLESKDFALINVHVPYAGEIAGTDAHIEFTDTDALEAHLGGEIDARAVLYCRTGPMSKTATQALVDRGYCAVYDVPAGMVGWQAAGYDLED